MFGNFAILDFGMPELVIILAIVMLLFGGKKLPELSKGLGQSMKNIREGLNEANGAKEDLKKTAAAITRPVAVQSQASEETPRSY
jgi:sec-independent protein translocase protein TatA